MIVRFSRKREYKGEEPDPSFTLGKNYLVFGIWFRAENKLTMVSIERDSDLTPVLVELQYFDIVDNRISDGWLIESYSDYGYTVKPQEFKGDFWDFYHDADPSAEAIYAQVKKKLKIDGVSID